MMSQNVQNLSKLYFNVEIIAQNYKSTENL